MTLPKTQHYVPQFVLRRFCAGAEQQIFVFDKQQEKTFSTSIKNVAAEQGFYNIESDNIIISIEPGLSDLESNAAVILARVIKDQSLEGLADNDRYVLAVFIALQFARVKQTRVRYRQIDDAIRSKLDALRVDPNSVSGYTPYYGDVDIKHSAVLGLAKNVLEFTPYLLNKSWMLFKATPTDKHYISDNPVTLQNQNDYKPYGNLGLAVKGIEIYFPISSELSLGLFCSTIAASIRAAWSQYLALKKADKLSSLNLERDAIEGLKRLKYGLETGRAVMSLTDNVINRNSLQVTQSTRFVYSIDGNFDLAYRILNDDPRYKEPPSLESD